MSARVCIRCGWFVMSDSKCPRDGGPTITVIAAARACNAAGLRELQHVTPTMRLEYFRRRIAK